LTNLDSIDSPKLMQRIFGLIKPTLLNLACHNRGNFLVIKYITTGESADSEWYATQIQNQLIGSIDKLLNDKHGLIILCKLIERANLDSI